MAKEVLPYSPTAKVDSKKSKIGYEIPFTRTFYEYKPIESAADIAKRIEAHEKKLMADLKALFGENGITETFGKTETHGTTGTVAASKLAERRASTQTPCRGSRGGLGSLGSDQPKRGGRR